MRFHKPAFILSVLMVVGSIALIFHQGPQLRHRLRRGVLMECSRSRSRWSIWGALRGKLDGLEIGEITLQTFGAPNTVLIRIPQQAGGDQATQPPSPS